MIRDKRITTTITITFLYFLVEDTRCMIIDIRIIKNNMENGPIHMLDKK